MKRFFFLAGCVILWSNIVLAQGAPTDVIFKHGFENHPDAVEILSFTANPAIIEEGESTTLSWTVRAGVNCTPSDGTAQWRALTLDGSSNSAEITDLDRDGVFQFTLDCAGIAGDSAAAVAIVTVEILTCEEPTLDAGIYTTWLAFWDQSFPNSSSQPISQPLNAGHYLGLQFETGAVINNGRFLTLDSVATDGTRLGTISRCFGHFEAPAECTHTWVEGQTQTTGIDWTTDDKVGACVLKPNTRYFFNVTFTNGVSSSTDTCTSDDCIALIQHDLNP